MTGSLRFRFFIIVWPLVVAITVGVGLYFGRWARVELKKTFDMVDTRPGPPAWVADRIAEALDGDTGDAPARAALTAIATELGAIDGEPAPLIVVSGEGRTWRSADVPPDASLDIDADGRLTYSRRIMRSGGQAEVATVVTGLPLRGGQTYYVLPTATEPEAGLVVAGPRRAGPANDGVGDGRDIEEFISAADRAITVAVIISSLIAGVATFLLAQPVVGQAARLAAAARRIRAGDLDARVSSPSGDELGDVARAFNDMAEELQRSEALRSQLIGDVAHELRTPLTNLVGGFEALEDRLMTPDEKTLGSLHQEAVLLQRLVQDLQELAVAEAGGLAMDLESVDLREAAEQAVASFGGNGARRGVAARVDVAGGDATDGAHHALADRRRVAQILRNLLQNAISHSPTGEAVVVSIAGDDQVVRVSVTDRGPGIAPEHQPLVWNRFHRLDAARARESGGVGLGLAIVKGLVEAQAGTVDLVSEPGAGATFSFSLPRAAA